MFPYIFVYVLYGCDYTTPCVLADHAKMRKALCRVAGPMPNHKLLSKAIEKKKRYEVHTISFLTFFVWALLLIVHT